MIPDMSVHDAPLRVFTMSDMRSIESSLPIPTKLLRVQVQDLVEVVVDVGTIRLDAT